ncbi:MAG: nucleoside permease [Alistipes sp.]|nr:nucleoside permease [Alistipes sp.]
MGGIKFRLIVMNFLQYAVWGSWLISLGAYLGSGLHFSGLQIGSFFATMGIASLFMPAVMGIIADRWIPAQKLLGICHLLSGALLVAAAAQTAYGPLYACMLLSVMFYMPTIALSNSVAYNALDQAHLDAVKHFPPIRVWGTVGFIAAMWFVDLMRIGGVPVKQTCWQLYVAALLSAVLAVYSFTLPACPVSRAQQRQSWIDTLGLRAFALFKQKRMAIFFVFSMLLGAALQITNAFGDSYIQSFGSMPRYADSLIVRHSVILLSLSQMSETLCILLIPFFLRRFGIKRVMLISMLAWVLRFGFFGIGNPGSGAAFLILSMVVYGVAFDFFNISGSLFVEQETGREIRSSAQGVFMIMTNGFGAFFGSYAAGAVVDAFGWPDSWYVFAGYALTIAVVFALVFRYKHDPARIGAVSH